MDPEALHFCHRCGRPCLSRGAGDLRYPSPPHPPRRAPPLLRPRCARRAEAAGAEGAPWRPTGNAARARGARGEAQSRRAPPIPRRPPSRLSQGRGRGGGGSCLRLAVKSRSCSSLSRARAHAAPTALLPSPASGSAAGAPVATPVTEPPATGPRQPARNPSKKLQDGSTSAADPETLPPPTARLPGA